MAHPLLPLAIAVACAVPSVNLNATSKDPMTCLKNDPSAIIIADSHVGEDPHGDDPHGEDPHDEVHDSKLPANKAKSAQKAPKDPYGDDPPLPNTRQPY